MFFIETVQSAQNNCSKFFINFIVRLVQIPDPDERLTKTNETCEFFYQIFMKFLTKWSIAGFFLVSAASTVTCQLKHGMGHIYAAELFHPIRIV